MEEECCLQEFYRATNKVQLVSMSSFIDQDTNAANNQAKKRLEDSDNLWKTFPRPVKRSSTIYFKEGQACGIVSANKQRIDLSPPKNDFKSSAITLVIKDIASASMQPEEVKTPHTAPVPHTKSVPTKISGTEPITPDLSRKMSMDLGLGGLSFGQQRDLKEKLTESLSPSPFKELNQECQENGLKQLVASAETKHLLLSPIYDSVAGVENSKYWKKALKDHILHTLQSLCLIKKLNEVPAKLLASKSVKLEQNAESNFTFITAYLLNETRARNSHF